MEASNQPKPHLATTVNWRLKPGYLSEGGSDFESVHILLGRFLADRTSENPLAEKELFAPDGIFEWKHASPLEKVINSQEDLEFLLKHPNLYRKAITIIEPWEHVGVNAIGEDVRASKNVAYIAQKVADMDSILLPVWSSGILDPELVVPAITSGYAVVVEGGDPSTYDASTWTSPVCPREDMFNLVEKLLISRSPTSAPAIFICVGHQLAAECHIRLIRRAVKEVLALTSLERDRSGMALNSLQEVCQRIEVMGKTLQVKKRDGRVVATGWNDEHFAVTRNESKEIGDRVLLPYQSADGNALGIPWEIIHAHDVTADAHEGVIDTTIQYEHEVSISMFHSDEVNEEAILLANWAYRSIHDAIVPYRHIIAGSSLSWLIQLPDAIEILCSTAEEDGEIVTECSATCINYKDFETKKIRRSFTCQFHPELLSDLRAIGNNEAPSYSTLKNDDGVRLFVRLLYAGMQE
jgi:GMP synthase-like glutamine amidotransferase